jgi:hypothetical protein
VVVHSGLLAGVIAVRACQLVSGGGRSVTMVQHLARWILPLAALFLVGPLVGTLSGDLRGSDGGPQATLLTSASLMMGLFAGLAGLAAAQVLAVIGSRAADVKTGLLGAGLVLAWAAWRGGSPAAVLLRDPSVSTLLTLALEGGLVGAGALLIVQVAHRAASPAEQKSEAALRSSAALVAMGVGALASLAVAHVIVFGPLRGQALFGAILAGVAAGAIGRLASSAMSETPAPRVAIYSGMVLAAILGPLVALVAPGGSSGALVGSVTADGLPGPVLIAPLEWAAGMLIGVPIGLNWAQASMHKSAPAASARAS